MIIQKVLNNNVVITIDPKTNKEVILMGCGIAFTKKAGDKVEEGKIEKKFSIEDKSAGNKLKKLINEIPEDILQITHEIIIYASKTLGKKLDDHLYTSLSDHITFAVKRYKNGIVVKNELLDEIRRIHKSEFKVATTALKYINKKMNINLTIDEAGFIALHLLNSSCENSQSNSIQSTNLIKEILDIIKVCYNMNFVVDDINYDRLLTHLKYFARRVLTNKQYDNDSGDLIELVQLKYNRAYKCALVIRDFIKDKYKYNVNDDEVVYLTLHIHRVTRNVEECISN
ncbi:MAG: BglG family transcription antiterminator LicT [Clostridium sp.]